MIIVRDKHENIHYPKKVEFYPMYDLYTGTDMYIVSFFGQEGISVVVDFDNMFNRQKQYIEINGVRYNYYDMNKNPEHIQAIIEQENTRMAIEALP